MRFDTKVLLGLMTPALALALGIAGCKSAPAPGAAPIQDASTTPVNVDPNADPAAANLCPAGPLTSAPAAGAVQSQPARVLGERTEAPQYTQQGENYAPQQQQGYPQQQGYQGPDDPNANYQNDVDAGQDALYANQAPPPLPVYEQPPAPEQNDQWNPGYWNYGNGGYYWVPGTWVAAPYYGALWTPPYWGYYGNRYRFHHGFWGLHIGFYGGVPYGFGYTGYGYEGGYWRGNDFYYNRAVNRIDPNIHSVYEHPVRIENNFNRVSYNGGPGGINVRPRPSEVLAFREQHTPAMQTQVAFAREAGANRAQFFAANHGQPQQIVHTQQIAAVRGIAAPQRVNYGNQAALANAQQRNENLQGRNAAEQQRNVQEQQRNQNLQGRNAVEQQRNVQEQQRVQNLQGRNAAEQQRNVQEQQRNQNLQGQSAAEQQRNVQQQQRNVQEQQRNVQEQQRNQQEQQRNQQLVQRNQAQAQQAQQRQTQQAQQAQRQAQQQQRNQQLQQRNQQEQQRAVQQRPAPQPQQRAPEPQRAAPAPQQRAAPQPQQHAAPAPQQRAPEPQQQHEGGHPRR